MKTTSVFWQPALQAPGEIVRGLDDIRQAIQIILRTPRGSDPHRPEFGSNLHLYIDWPVDRAIPHVVRESVEAQTDRPGLRSCYGADRTRFY